MPNFRYIYPIQVRFGDIDSQGHVNNARIVTYFEQARIFYLKKLALWDGLSFLDLGVIVADVHVTYLAPVHLDQAVQVGMGVTRLGNKSMTMDAQLENSDTHRLLATCVTVMVAYDYHQGASILIPEDWREKIAGFEGIPPHS